MFESNRSTRRLFSLSPALLIVIFLAACEPFGFPPADLLSSDSGPAVETVPAVSATNIPASTAAPSPQPPPPTIENSIPFQDSDCNCIGLSLSSADLSTHRLTCNFEWTIKVGESEDTNKVQTELAPWSTLDEAQKTLNAEAASLQAQGGQVTLNAGQSLYDLEPQGTGGFYYGEGRMVYAEGYSLSTHVRGYYATGDVLAILHQADQCMQVALNLHHR